MGRPGPVQSVTLEAMKTHKAIAKRFKVTKTGKVLKRATGQDHFNARESGNTTRAKRRDIQLTGVISRTLKSQVQK
jgi:ribosomal protein L35